MENNTDQPVVIIPLKEGFTDAPIYQCQIDKWQEEYPGLNVLEVLKDIRDWNQKLPNSKRMTCGQVGYHIVNWLKGEV